ncbi:uncharacterized protein EV154DRAFT_511380 [Mucor mucedo]|uniref:uncharacterized protein n=1 Tax=Mucor mucedo TaxID=29922 RepID=UPI00221F3194|nr:uncharacterized protein EV154DRAFT_511380 [Mucor mucedo]KAI7890365.1 hypothetical protein EV154DRAFT_511380 [Mucor mucedo]
MNSPVNTNQPAAAFQGAHALMVTYSSSSESESSGSEAGSGQESSSGSGSDVVYHDGNDSDSMDVDNEGTPATLHSGQGEDASSVSPVVDSVEGSDYVGQIKVLQNQIDGDAAKIIQLTAVGDELLHNKGGNFAELPALLNANLAMMDYLNKRVSGAHESLVSLKKQEASLLEVTNRTNKLSIKGSKKKELDHTAVKAKDLPVFNVRPMKARKMNGEDDVNDEHMLCNFVLAFERAYKNENVNVNKHWYPHLEDCLEKRLSSRFWFDKVIKPEYKADEKLHWLSAVKMMQDRFVISSDKGIQKDNEVLFENGAIGPKDTLVEFIFKYSVLEINGNISTKDNYLFTACFIWKSKNEKLKAKVMDAMSEYMNSTQQGVSIHAATTDEAFCEFYADFGNVTKAIYRKLTILEHCLEEEREKIPSFAGAGSSSGASHEKSKKRKTKNSSGARVSPPWSSPAPAPASSSSSVGSVKDHVINYDLVRLDEIYKPFHHLNADERNFLFKMKKCLNCIVAPFSPAHLETCPARKHYKKH